MSTSVRARMFRSSPIAFPRPARVLALILLMLGGLSTLAEAQVPPGTIPPSALPGREREQFQVPQGPRALPRGPTVSLPSTTAPEEAKTTKLVIRRITIVGSTIYRPED